MILLTPSKDLNESAELISKRILMDEKSKTQRPNLTDLSHEEEIFHMLKTRERLYDKAKDYVIYVLKLENMDVAKKIIDLLNL